MIRTITQSKKGTNLECILDVEPAGPADEVNGGGKGTRNPEQFARFLATAAGAVYRNKEKGNCCLFSCFELPV